MMHEFLSNTKPLHTVANPVVNSLANWLLKRAITTVVTLNTNRIGIPDELRQTKDREEFSATCHVDSSGNLYLTSYAVRTKSKGK